MKSLNHIFNKLFHKRPVVSGDNPLTTEDTNAVSDFEKNRIIVRVWTSAACGAKRLGKSVGHVSLQLNPYDIANSFISNEKKDIKFYMSLWPKKNDDDSNNYHLNSLKEDFVDEKRPPEYTFCFYSLSKNEIMEKYQQLYSELKGWDLLCKADEKGKKCSGEHSCVSFVKTLLMAGGLENLISIEDIRKGIAKELLNDTAYGTTGFLTCRSDKLFGASANCVEQIFSNRFNSPDAFVTLLQIAKDNEIKKFPLTQSKNLYYREETLVPTYSYERTQDDHLRLPFQR